MSTFEDVKTALCDVEGGYTRGVGDYGGETKYGISQRQYPNLNIKTLTFPEACVILERDFWVRYRIGEIQSQELATKVFLAFINMNPIDAARSLQRAANEMQAGIVTDGVMGSVTIRIINTLNEQILIDKLRIELARYYLKRVQLDRTQVPNLPSWLRRALL